MTFCCLELAARLEEDERDLEREVVLQVRADLLIRALGVAGDPFEVLLDLGVVVDLEMIGRVDLPAEVVVANLVLAVVGDIRRLRLGSFGGRQHHKRGQEHRRDAPPGRAAYACA